MPPFLACLVFCCTLLLGAAESRSRENSREHPRASAEKLDVRKTPIASSAKRGERNSFKLKDGQRLNASTVEVRAQERHTDPLAKYTPEQQARAHELSGRIGTVARTLVRDATLTVEAGDWWAYHFADGSRRHRITYPVHDMLGHSDTYAMGVIGHEISHALHSRIPDGAKIPNKAFHFLWNAIEDIRVNKLISGRYAGLPALLQNVYKEYINNADAGGSARMIRCEQFAYGFIYEWAAGGRIMPDVVDADVVAAMKEARSLVAEAARLPPGLDLRFDVMSKEEVDSEALRSFEIIRGQIWPLFDRLLQKDLSDPRTKEKAEKQQKEGEGDAQQGQDGQEGQQGKQGEKKGRAAGKGETDGKGKNNEKDEKKGGGEGQEKSTEHSKEQSKASGFDENGDIEANQVPHDPLKDKTGDRSLVETKEALDKLFERAAKEMGSKVRESERAQDEEHKSVQQERHRAGKGDNNLEAGEGGRRLLDYEGDTNYGLEEQQKALEERQRRERAFANLSFYDKRRDKFRRVIDDGVAEIGNAILRDDLPEWSPPMHRSGKYDLRKGLQSKLQKKATGRSDPKVFRRRGEPQERRTEIIWVIDKSGSMVGPPMDAALDATIVIQEIMAELKLPYGVVAYDEQPYLLAKLEKHDDLKAREQVVLGLRARGNTNDPGALSLARQMFESSIANNKIVLFLTDGGCAQDAKDYVERTEKETDLKVIGIGIGAGEAEVPIIFRKHHLVVPDVRKLARGVARLIKEAIIENGG